MKKIKNNQTVIPLLALRDIVVFPGMITPLFVGRSKSISALEEVMSKDKKIFLVTQKNAETDDPLPDEIYTVGCIGKVIQLLKLPDGTIKALIEAQDKAKILKYIKKDDNYYSVNTELIDKKKFKKFKNIDEELEKSILKLDMQFLHAKVLGFRHPSTGKELEFSSILPQELENMLKKLRNTDK